MAHDFPMLLQVGDAASLEQELLSSVSAGRAWERFIELRMSAGPTVSIRGLGNDCFAVSVEWGAAQSARLNVVGAKAALRAADRCVGVFYDIRAAGATAD